MAEGRRIVLTGRTADGDTTLEVGPVARGTYPTAAFAASTASTDNTNDKAAGTGALTATIRGLDLALVEKEETITLNGTGAVVTTQTFVRINEVRVRTCGSNLSNTGTITTQLNSQTHATIPIGYSRSNGLHYSTPADSYLELTGLTLSGAEYVTTNVIRAQIQVKRIANAGGLPWEVIAEADFPFGGARFASVGGGIIIPGGYDLRVFVATSINSVIMSGNITGTLVPGGAPANLFR